MISRRNLQEEQEQEQGSLTVRGAGIQASILGVDTKTLLLAILFFMSCASIYIIIERDRFAEEQRSAVVQKLLSTVIANQGVIIELLRNHNEQTKILTATMEGAKERR